MVTAEMRPDGLTTVLSRGRTGERLPTDPAEWPEVHPPFYGGTLPIDPHGRTWVRRYTQAGEPCVYDVFDPNGILLGKATIDRGKSIVGFGSHGVFVSALGEGGIRTLEVHPLPEF
jgi:hypothetical protein